MLYNISFIRFFHQSHNTVLFGGLFTLKQWIISSLKHDTVPRVNKLYCFYVKNPPKCIALWDRENNQCKEKQIENYGYAFLADRADLHQCTRKRGPKPLKKARGAANLDFSCLQNEIWIRFPIPQERNYSLITLSK